MDGPAADPAEESIGGLIGRLVEDGRAYAEAELALARAIAQHRAQRAGLALGLLGAGAALLLSAVTALVLGLALGLSQYISPFLAGLIVAILLAGCGWLLVGRGLAGMKGLGRDKAEQQAIDEGLKP